MKRTARACCRISVALAVWLAVAVPAVHAEPSHLRQAGYVEEAGAGWDAPAAVPAAIAATAGASSVTLPHVRRRAVAAVQATALALPEVGWYRLEVASALRSQASPGELVLYLPRWQTVGNVAVYAGDRLAWRSTGSRVWNSFNRPLWVPL